VKEKAKQMLSFLLRFGLSAALLIYLFQKDDLIKAVADIKNANLTYLALALFCNIIIYGILLLRWNMIIKGLHLALPLKRVAKWFWIGMFFNLTLPTSTGGDIVKAIGLCKGTHDRAKVIASILLDRLFGFIAITLVAFVSYFAVHQIANNHLLLITIIVLFAVSWGGLLFLLNEKLYTFMCGIFNRLPRIKEKLLKFHQAIILIKNKAGLMGAVIALSCLSQALLGLSYFFTAQGLHQNVNVVYCIAFAPLVCVASSMPSVGGFGFRESALVCLFLKVGLLAAKAKSIALLNSLYLILLGLVGACVYVSSVFTRRLQRHPSDSADGRPIDH